LVAVKFFWLDKKMLQKIINFKNIWWLVALVYFYKLMVFITLQYIPVQSNVAFLQIKQTEVQQVWGYLWIFYVHVFSSIFVLVAGFSQFDDYLLLHLPKTHRAVGKMYVFVVLGFAAPSGFFIGLFANGGFFSKISFTLLAMLWFFFTFNGLRYIKNKKVVDHKKMMLRSFALAFSAITLRFWKVILVYLYQPNPMDLYQIIAWLGWIPNLLFIEYYIFKKIKA
jgi:Predicted membrane protein (DUF2306)